MISMNQITQTKCQHTHHFLNKNECWTTRTEILNKWNNLGSQSRIDLLIEAGATEQQYIEFQNASLKQISKLMTNGQEIAEFCFWTVGGLKN